jgi:signal transduction histidine kinase
VSARLSARYFLASIALLVALVAVYTVSTARRTQAELRAQLEDKGQALAEAVEAGGVHAIRANALIEEAITERLLDNARLIDELLRGPFDTAELARLAQRNRLRGVELLDLDGRPWTPPAPPPAPPWAGAAPHRMLMRGPGGGSAEAPPDRPMMRGPGGANAAPPDRPMMRYMWGRRWGRGLEPGAEAAPAAIRDRTFRNGSVFGVAVGATAFRGIIAVHADAADILDFRREVGVDRQLADLAARGGVVAAAVLGADGAVLAHAEPAADGAAGRFEVVRPLTLDGGRQGTLRVAFSTEPMERAWRRDVRAGVVLGGAVLLVGALGMALIFYVQQRHLRELRALEAEVAQRGRLAALGDVAAAFAHEVRNPLNAVSMGLQRLRAEFTPAPVDEYARFVDLMQGEVRRLNAIVEQFIALARPLPLAPAPLALDGFLGGLAALVESQARAAGVAVRVTVPTPAPVVMADRDHLEQVLLNLMLNAVQAMEPGGTLSIEAQPAREAVVITVADTGPGIAADVLPRIFDPYFTTKRGGLGLGLTIARRIVEAHGGTLDVESDRGRGSRFRVRLPAAPR